MPKITDSTVYTCTSTIVVHIHVYTDSLSLSLRWSIVYWTKIVTSTSIHSFMQCSQPHSQQQQLRIGEGVPYVLTADVLLLLSTVHVHFQASSSEMANFSYANTPLSLRAARPCLTKQGQQRPKKGESSSKIEARPGPDLGDLAQIGPEPDHPTAEREIFPGRNS